MQESGCFPEEAACWTEWIAVSNPRAWYEGVQYRIELPTGVGRTEPPNFFTPYDIVDPRASCDVNCDGEDELAAGTWYVNLMARPSMPYYELQGGVWKTYCDWRFDYKYYWFVFPTRVGVNRFPGVSREHLRGFPHTRGGEPGEGEQSG